jgi:DNA-binding NarL/FixJ family response regulator
MKTQSIFLVEDSALVRERLIEMIESVPGARVVGLASRADEALRGILAARPDLVVLDLNLAQGTGIDVLRALRLEAPRIDVYMLSGYATAPYRQLARRLGARDFFDKSTEFARVKDVVAARAARPH